MCRHMKTCFLFAIFKMMKFSEKILFFLLLLLRQLLLMNFLLLFVKSLHVFRSRTT